MKSSRLWLIGLTSFTVTVLTAMLHERPKAPPPTPIRTVQPGDDTWIAVADPSVPPALSEAGSDVPW